LNKRRLLALAAGLALAGGMAAGGVMAGSADASTVIAKVNNTAIGEAGYFINDNGKTRIRDVQAVTVITPQMEDLNGSATTDEPAGAPGGVGVELCNENTGYAAQLGLEWDGAAFVAEYNYSGNAAETDPLLTITSGSDPDPCAEGGLLDNGDGETFTNFLNATPDTAPGAIHIGDVIKFEIYYAPKGHRDHTLSFTITDETQDVTRVQTVRIPAENFYEAGIGVVSLANDLTGGPVNLVNTFTSAFFNWYGNGYGARHAPQGILQPSHWDLEWADFVNGSNQVTLTPGALLTGNTSFPMLEGSTSA
jgi:hypothetical protein